MKGAILWVVTNIKAFERRSTGVTARRKLVLGPLKCRTLLREI